MAVQQAGVFSRGLLQWAQASYKHGQPALMFHGRSMLTTNQQEPGAEDATAAATGGTASGPAARLGAAAARRLSGLNERAAGKTDLYVGNVHPTVTTQLLKHLFAQFGPVHEVRLVKSNLKRNVCFGFVSLPSENVQQAIQAVHGLEVAGRSLVVQEGNPGTPPRTLPNANTTVLVRG